jgi:putative ABC transport system substrate-binding protein
MPSTPRVCFARPRASRILRGKKPSDIPYYQGAAFALIVNLKTAKALEIDLPSWLLARTDEAIE